MYDLRKCVEKDFEYAVEYYGAQEVKVGFGIEPKSKNSLQTISSDGPAMTGSL